MTGVQTCALPISPKYIFEILRQLRKDRPDIVHLQHEINMYGGVMTALLFPWLLLLLKIHRYKVVVTIHAAVNRDLIDKKFIYLFHKNPHFVRPFLLKSFFSYIFKTISFFFEQDYCAYTFNKGYFN